MLIDSPRLTARDREDWARRSRYDAALARGLRDKPDVARARIVEWAAGFDGPVTVAVSWGKDSVTVAELALTSEVADRVELVWVRQLWHENPDCEPVRDAFLARHPGARYAERTVTSPHPRRWDPDATGQYRPPAPRRGGVWPERRVTGIRAAESDARRMSANVHGAATAMTCRPVIDWSTRDVMAFLAAEDLPVHPAYAMTSLARADDIRVHSLGGLAGLRDRGPWEDAYYGDVIRAERLQVACLRILPGHKTRRLHASSVHARIVSLVMPCQLHEVVGALEGLRGRGWVARWERCGSEGWWRWEHARPLLPGSPVVGDLAGEARVAVTGDAPEELALDLG